MTRFYLSILLCSLTWYNVQAAETSAARAEKAPAKDVPACFGQSRFHEAWIKVAERTCIKCHNAEGDASGSEFLLNDASRVPAAKRAGVMIQNCAAFTKMAHERGRRPPPFARQSHRRVGPRRRPGLESRLHRVPRARGFCPQFAR